MSLAGLTAEVSVVIAFAVSEGFRYAGRIVVVQILRGFVLEIWDLQSKVQTRLLIFEVLSGAMRCTFWWVLVFL